MYANQFNISPRGNGDEFGGLSTHPVGLSDSILNESFVVLAYGIGCSLLAIGWEFLEAYVRRTNLSRKQERLHLLDHEQLHRNPVDELEHEK